LSGSSAWVIIERRCSILYRFGHFRSKLTSSSLLVQTECYSVQYRPLLHHYAAPRRSSPRSPRSQVSRPIEIQVIIHQVSKLGSASAISSELSHGSVVVRDFVQESCRKSSHCRLSQRINDQAVRAENRRQIFGCILCLQAELRGLPFPNFLPEELTKCSKSNLLQLKAIKMSDNPGSVFLTGANGFVASHILAQLLEVRSTVSYPC
jgi:hypothetical protein